MLQEGQGRADLEKLGYEFRLSFYRNNIIQYEKGGEDFTERFQSRTMPTQRNYIETKPVDRAKFNRQNLVGLGKTTSIKKFMWIFWVINILQKKKYSHLNVDKTHY